MKVNEARVLFDDIYTSYNINRLWDSAMCQQSQVVVVSLLLLSHTVTVAVAQTIPSDNLQQQHVVSKGKKGSASNNKKTKPKQNCPNIAGLWTGTLHDSKNSDYSITLKVDLKPDGDFEGTLTNVGKEGTSKHYLKGQYNEQQDQFVAKDIGVDKSDGSDSWFPVAVDLYTLSIVEDGKKLVGSCRQSDSNESLWISLSRENGQETDTSKASALPPGAKPLPSAQSTVTTGSAHLPLQSSNEDVISKQHDTLTELQQNMLELINHDRADNHLQLLQPKDKLNAFASDYATQMLRDNISDQNSIEAKTLHDRAKEAGLDPNIAENTAWQNKNGEGDTEILNKAEESVMTGSAKGRDNILSPDYKYVGVGIASSETKVFVVQTFSASDPDHPMAASEDNSGNALSTGSLNSSPEPTISSTFYPSEVDPGSIIPFDTRHSYTVPQNKDVPNSVAPVISNSTNPAVPSVNVPNPAPPLVSPDLQSASALKQHRKIAVLPFSLQNTTNDVGDVDVGAEFAKVLSQKIDQMPGWAPIDQNDVSALLQRKDSDDLSGTDIGKLLGADAVIIGTVQSFGFEHSYTNNGAAAASYIPYIGGFFVVANAVNSAHNARYGHAKIDIDAKLVDVYSGKELSSLKATAISPKSVAKLWGASNSPISNFLSTPFATSAAGEVTFAAVDSICAQLTTVQAQVDALAINHVQGKVTDVDDDLVCINAGKTQGLKAGDKLVIEQASDDSKSYIGTVVLTDVTEQTSIGKVVDEKGLILADDTVRIDVQDDTSQSIGALSRSSTQ